MQEKWTDITTMDISTEVTLLRTNESFKITQRKVHWLHKNFHRLLTCASSSMHPSIWLPCPENKVSGPHEQSVQL